MPCRNNVEAESRELRARFEAAETRLTDKDDMIADLRQQRDLAQASPATAQGRITALLTDQRVVIRPCAGDGGYGGGADNSHFTESLLRISTGSQSVKPESAQSIVRPIPEFATGPNFGNYIFYSPLFSRYNRRVIKGFGMSKSTISTYQLFEMVPDAEAGRLWLESHLWPNGPRCPVCGLGDRITARKGGYYRCRQCKEDFTVRTGTVMERSHIPLHKWVYTMYLLVTARKGISTPPTILQNCRLISR